MKRYYRNRIILGAMLSFFLLLVFAISGIWLFSYQQMESETDSFLSRMHRTGAEEQPAGQPAPPRMFGYTPRQLRYLSAFYVFTVF